MCLRQFCEQVVLFMVGQERDEKGGLRTARTGVEGVGNIGSKEGRPEKIKIVGCKGNGKTR